MDVAGRREPAHLPGQVHGVARLDEAAPLLVELEELLVLHPLDDPEHAPGHVIVDRRHLSGSPDKGDDREASIGLGVEHVAPVVLGVPGSLLRPEDAWRRKLTLQFRGHQPGRLPPAGVLADHGADSRRERVELTVPDHY
jgi:hypothetical protein